MLVQQKNTVAYLVEEWRKAESQQVSSTLRGLICESSRPVYAQPIYPKKIGPPGGVPTSSCTVTLWQALDADLERMFAAIDMNQNGFFPTLNIVLCVPVLFLPYWRLLAVTMRFLALSQG